MHMNKGDFMMKFADSVFCADGKPFFPIGIQAHNSSGYSLEELNDLWKACELMKVNSCAIAVSWERFEYQEGQFDRDLVKTIISACRERNLKLILLWFGSWKNGHMKYVPQWVKKDRERFPRVITHDGYEISNLSSFSQNTRDADCRAFCELMKVIREEEETAAVQTVIAVQVQNELGIVGRSIRDYGETAQKIFLSPVPEELIAHLKTADAREEIVMTWNACGRKEAGTWPELFGRHADECLQACSMAKYVDYIAQKGKEIYPLPMYTNVWQDKQEFDIPGINYPSGGPVSKNIAVWKWMAPHLDMICPDIYIPNQSGYDALAAAYAREDNPLYLPETGSGLPFALGMVRAIEKFGLTGVHFFGAEHVIAPDGGRTEASLPAYENFQFLTALAPLLLKYRDSGKIHAVCQEEFARNQLLFFDGWRGVADFGEYPRKGDYHHANAPVSRGRGLVIQTGEDEFILGGAGFLLRLREMPSPLAPYVPQEDNQQEYYMDYITVEEGYVDESGEWHATRIRNGDETDFGIFVYPDHGAVRVVADRRKKAEA